MKKFATLTIGQAPRPDLAPCLLYTLTLPTICSV